MYEYFSLIAFISLFDIALQEILAVDKLFQKERELKINFSLYLFAPQPLHSFLRVFILLLF